MYFFLSLFFFFFFELQVLSFCIASVSSCLIFQPSLYMYRVMVDKCCATCLITCGSTCIINSSFVCYSWHRNGGSRQSEFRDRISAGQTNSKHGDPPAGHPSVGPEIEQVPGQSHWLLHVLIVQVWIFLTLIV